MFCVKEKGNRLPLVMNVLTGQTVLRVSIVQTPLLGASGEGSGEFWEVCRKELDLLPIFENSLYCSWGGRERMLSTDREMGCSKLRTRRTRRHRWTWMLETGQLQGGMRKPVLLNVFQ